MLMDVLVTFAAHSIVSNGWVSDHFYNLYHHHECSRSPPHSLKKRESWEKLELWGRGNVEVEQFVPSVVTPTGGLEPPTTGLKGQRSTDWARQAHSRICFWRFGIAELSQSPNEEQMSNPDVTGGMVNSFSHSAVLASNVDHERIGNSYTTFCAKLHSPGN